MMPVYRLYGKTLQSNRPLPGLPTAPSDHPIDFRLKLTDTPHPANPEPDETLRCELSGKNENRLPLLRVWYRSTDGRFRYRYSDGTGFTIDRFGKRISANWLEPLTLDDMTTYLLGPILGFALRLQGIVCLHASAVCIEDRAVAFLMPAGHGKSTLAAAFGQAGYPVIADDIVALTDQETHFSVDPAYPQIRLWPASVKALLGASDALPPISTTDPEWDKCHLDLQKSGYRFERRRLPLAAVYTGGKSDDPAAPKIESLNAQAGLVRLLANSYADYMLDRPMKAHEFEVMGRLAEKTSFRWVTARESISDIPLLRRLIIEDFRSVVHQGN